jgi:holo-[acyl-carrier protein] synthase
MILGTGIDIIEVSRIEKAAEKERFIKRIYTLDERAYHAARGSSAQTLAGMFAAKEAVAKALESGVSGGISWQDIEICHHENNMPYVKLKNAALEKMLLLGGRRVHVAISHIKELAVAQAVLED